MPGHAPEEDIDRRTVIERPGLGRVMKPAVCAQNQMIVRAGEQNLSLGQLHSVSDELDFSSRVLAQPLAQPGGEGGVYMLHDHDRRFQGRGKLGEDLRQRERPSGRRAEQNQGVQGRLLDRPLDRSRSWQGSRTRWRLADQFADHVDLAEQ